MPEQIPVESERPMLAYEASLALALCTGAQPGYCYANIWHAFRELESLTEAHLVEGWLVWEQDSLVAVIEHCWCEQRGTILDPSVVLLTHRSQPLFYYPGVRRAKTEIETVACAALPLVRSLGQYGNDGFGHPAYHAAYQGASTQAQHLACASSAPKAVVVQPASNAGSSTQRLVVKVVSSRSFFRVSSWPRDDQGQAKLS